MRKLLIIVIAVSLYGLAFAQDPLEFEQENRSGFLNSKNWEQHKHEVFFNVGLTGFLGDVGGLNRIGTTKSPADLDGASLRFTVGGGYRFRFHPRFATTTHLAYAMFSGDDAHTEEIIRNSRNISFRTHSVELGQRIEFILYAKESSTGIMPDGNQRRERADLIYLFGGINGFLYVPQTKINGKWKNLRPLKTEGQGLPGGAKKYGLFNFGIPVGAGFRLGINNGWRIGLEVSYTKTFTDYLDDVSTVYYSPAKLMEHGGEDAVYAGNPAKANHSWFGTGQQRGNDKDMDAYLFVNVVVTKNITTNDQKPRVGKFRNRAKF